MSIPEIKFLIRKLNVDFGFKESTFNFYIIYQFKSYYDAVSICDRSKVFKCLRKISFFNKNLSLHLLAYYLFLNKKFDLSLQFLDKLLSGKPNHTSSIYLKVKNLVELNRIDEAIDILKEILKFSQRKKTWLIWANIISTSQDFDLYNFYWKKYNEKTNDVDLVNYLVLAALRCKQYDCAIYSLEKLWASISSKKIKINLKTSFTPIPQKNAEIALAQIKYIFKKNGIDFFLISGTLLGFIRENKILGHDKDLDIGIWNKYDINHIKSLIQKIGTFEILPIRSNKVLRVRHFNNVCIDIFFHEISNNQVIHSGVKSNWINSKFELKSINFLNNEYLIPLDYDKYLSENYGNDWLIPKIKFDSSIDTPNIIIKNEHEMIAYCYQKLFLSYSQNDHKNVQIYLDKIKHYSTIIRPSS